MWNDRYTAAGLHLWARVNLDPATMTLATAGSAALGGGGMAATMLGSAFGMEGQLAAGDYAEQAGKMARAGAEFEAKQLDANAQTTLEVGARQATERRVVARQAIGTSRARAAASGVNAAEGSAAENEVALAGRGEQQALNEIFSAENTATGIKNKAAGVRYSGELAELEGQMKKKASRTAAIGTLASGVGSTFSQAGRVFFPTPGRSN